METANAFLPTFIAEYNARFGVTPRHPEDAHRPVLHTPAEVDWILSRQHTRKLSKNLCSSSGTGNTRFKARGVVIDCVAPQSPSAKHWMAGSPRYMKGDP
ncbi:hypothetical protein LLY24_07895 [Halomonas sp. wenzhen-202101]|uniref:Transposase n=1 Tax=Halomonas dongshanensis TaxID=2890835 RepID=A0ABT2ECD1_9GAMM|nr:hypothetical protein [Halomonas dongshanensis]MCS2609237.1 hypothetical protein [Halomonas dongshanensis]